MAVIHRFGRIIECPACRGTDLDPITLRPHLARVRCPHCQAIFVQTSTSIRVISQEEIPSP